MDHTIFQGVGLNHHPENLWNRGSTAEGFTLSRPGDRISADTEVVALTSAGETGCGAVAAVAGVILLHKNSYVRLLPPWDLAPEHTCVCWMIPVPWPPDILILDPSALLDAEVGR